MGLAPHEEELGKMDTLRSITYAHVYCWICLSMGVCLMKVFCDCTPVADKNHVTFSSKSPRSPVPSPKIRYVGLVSSCLGSGSTLPVGFIASCLSSGGTVVELSR